MSAKALYRFYEMEDEVLLDIHKLVLWWLTWENQTAEEHQANLDYQQALEQEMTSRGLLKEGDNGEETKSSTEEAQTGG